MRLFLMVEGQEDVSWRQWLDLAQAVERCGLEGLFRSDHYLSTFGGAGRQCLDAWTTLAALATRTERIRLGTLVSPVTFRHPAVLAKSAATVDHVSGGRVELGMGTGWNEGEHEAYGFLFPALRERMEQLEEQLEIVVKLWTDERASFAGRHYRLQDCPSLPKPLQRPHPPLIIGGSAGPRSAALAARFADEYNTYLATLEEVTERRRRIHEACERAGRDPATIRFSVMTACCVGHDRDAVLERARLILRRFGEEDEDPAELLRRREDTWVAGSSDEAVARLRELGEAGVDRVYLQHLAHEDLETVELLGAEVAPAVS